MSLTCHTITLTPPIFLFKTAGSTFSYTLTTRTNTVAVHVRPSPAHQHLTRTLGQVLLALSRSSLLMLQCPGPASSWQIWKSLTPGAGVAQPWPLWSFGEESNGWKAPLLVSPSLTSLQRNQEISKHCPQPRKLSYRH